MATFIMFKFMLCLAFLGQALACKTGMNETTAAPSIYEFIKKDETQSRVERATERFIDPGNGQKCALSPDHSGSGNFFFDHVDEKGNHCECPLCPEGQVLKGNCSCADPLAARVTRCEFVEQNHFMEYRSKCETGVPCKTCEWPWRVNSFCSPRGPDTVCECVAADHYLVSPDDCRPVPRCDKGSEPTLGHGEDYTERRCQPCPVGYYQPDDNSTNRCIEARKCTVKESTSVEDAKCLNDPEPDELSTAPMTTSYPQHDQAESSTVAPSNIEKDVTDVAGAMSDGQVTASDGDVTSTPIPTGTTNNTMPPVDVEGRPLPPCFSIPVYVISVVVAFMAGIVVPVKWIRKRCQRRQYSPRTCRNPGIKLSDFHLAQGDELEESGSVRQRSPSALSGVDHGQ